MRRIVLPLLLIFGVGTAFLATLVFLVVQSRTPTEEVEIITPVVADVVLQTVATGAIVPRVEVEIKSRVSGVVHQLHVEPGQTVRGGDLIAEIRVIPDSASLNQAQSSVQTARINLDSAAAELDRAVSLSARQAISSRDLDLARSAHALATQEFDAATSHLQIVREGATRGTGNVSTQVRATVAGMVLTVGVEEGESVTETNTFNAGTTVASIADMSDMVFLGLIDESEVGRIREGMPLRVVVGALRDRRIEGTLEYISPKGAVSEGTVQFEIRAAIQPEEDLFVRAGSSANADIVLDRRDQVLTIDEKALRFDDGAASVEVETSPGVFEQRPVRVGLSDGLKIEVLEGLDGSERLKGGAVPPPGGGTGGRRKGH